jgi:hypothetical protein
MAAEFSVDYELVVDAANGYEDASSQFKEIIQKFGELGEQLSTTWFVGLTGNAAASSLEVLQGRLNELVSQADEIRQDLLTTVASFRDDIDPDMASRFEN